MFSYGDMFTMSAKKDAIVNMGGILGVKDADSPLILKIKANCISYEGFFTYGGLSGFRTSSAFILVGHVLFTLPFMVRSVLAVLSVIDLKTLEEGAASLGAGFRQRFFDIVLPNCRNGILAGSLMVVTLSMGEFNMTWLLHTPLTKTLPVGLADAYASLRLEIGSAYTLMFFLMITPLLLGLQWLARPRRRAFAPSEEE